MERTEIMFRDDDSESTTTSTCRSDCNKRHAACVTRWAAVAGWLGRQCASRAGQPVSGSTAADVRSTWVELQHVDVSGSRCGQPVAYLSERVVTRRRSLPACCSTDPVRSSAVVCVRATRRVASLRPAVGAPSNSVE